MQALKDDQLIVLAADHNIAQFASFGPGPQPYLRHRRIRGVTQHSSSPAEVIRSLLESSPTCNIRTFHTRRARGTPFNYGLTNIDEILAALYSYARQGYYTIVNETIDVNDGGVSGVASGGILEFAPQDTPRAVEKPGILSVPHHLGIEILKGVYGFTPDIPDSFGKRIEFSLHPTKAGLKRDHTILWQINDVSDAHLDASLKWPNKFSRFLGDKAFGLLVADCLSVPVPMTIVVPRTVAPFSFGRSTGNGERWIRTCPVVSVPGKYPTFRSWRDPFKLMSDIDPTGDSIGSIISQHGVDSKFSGATWPGKYGHDRVEGVSGLGDDFMLGRRSPTSLPDKVVRDVQELTVPLKEALGDVRIEWAHDGVAAWILQLHLVDVFARNDDIFNVGEARQWVSFDPGEGLDRLRQLVGEASASGAGIEITDLIGITSHVGEILREAGIPARMTRREGSQASTG